MAKLIQPSFAAGEIDPAMHSRVDVARHAIALALARNGAIRRSGGFESRPGTKWICPIAMANSFDSTRLVDFRYSDVLNYVLVFSHLKMRVISGNTLKLEDSRTITDISTGNPAVVTYSGTDMFDNGQMVLITDLAGGLGEAMNGRYFLVSNVNVGANTFELDDLTGANFSTSALPAYTSGGTAGGVYELTTTISYSMLSSFQYAQNAESMTIVHSLLEPQDLVFTLSTETWAISAMSQTPVIGRPGAVTVSSGGAGAVNIEYAVTAISAETGEESLRHTDTTNSITGISQTNPAVVTYAGGDNINNGGRVLITGVVGMTEVNGREFIAANVNTGANTFELRDVDATLYTAWSSGGTVTRLYYRLSNAITPTPSAPHVLSWTASAGALEYNVYKSLNGVFGFIGVSRSLTFDDIGYSPDTSVTAPTQSLPFSAINNYPAVVNYVQQRRAFAATLTNPESIWMSALGNYTNFSVRSPVQDDDALKFRLAGRNINRVRHILDISRMLIMTGSGEHVAKGDSNGVITPTSPNVRQYSYTGASDLRPLVAGGVALYVQAQGSVVRDLVYDINSEGYTGNELSIYSSHLVDGYRINDWCYQQVPYSRVWAVRSDGVLLCMTYVREQQLVAWTRCDLQDSVIESIITLPDGFEDAVYIGTRRTVDGQNLRYIERFNSRHTDEEIGGIGGLKVSEFAFMDSSYTRDGRNFSPAHTMTLTTGTVYTQGTALTLTSSTAYFTSAFVGQQIHLSTAAYGLDLEEGTVIRATITAYSSTTVVTVVADSDIPVALQAAATANWNYAINRLTGLWHLEGEEVSVVGDGAVVASPYNPNYTALTVADGAIDLGGHYALIHVGLPFIVDMETLDIDIYNNQPIADQKKLVSKLAARFRNTRGVWAGPARPTDDDTDALEGLVEFKMRDQNDYEIQTPKTGVESLVLNSGWTTNGKVFIRQVDPLPMTVLSVMPVGMFPGVGG